MEYHMGPANSSEEFEGSGRIIREQAPRHLNLFSKLIIVFGGVTQQMGWAFGGFGLIFFWVFVMNSEARYLLAFDGKWTDTDGIITNISSTNAEVNDRVVFAYEFTYNVKGRILKATSYGTSSGSYEVNSPVGAQYKSLNPERARIKGMSSSIFPIWVIFVCIFPLIGFIMVFSSLIYNLKALRLFIHGTFTKGTLKNKIPTNTSINNQTVFKYEFEFDVDGTKHLAICKTHQGWKIEDEEQEIILYAPNNPKHAVIYDAVAAAPEITPRGELDAIPLYRLSNLILPVLAISVNAILYYLFIVLKVF
jgi:hypothetical protein